MNVLLMDKKTSLKLALKATRMDFIKWDKKA
jgi:hypothetical protein